MVYTYIIDQSNDLNIPYVIRYISMYIYHPQLPLHPISGSGKLTNGINKTTLLHAVKHSYYANTYYITMVILNTYINTYITMVIHCNACYHANKCITIVTFTWLNVAALFEKLMQLRITIYSSTKV